MGRNPKPLSEHRKDKTVRCSEHRHRVEDEFERGKPAQPDKLDEHALRMWSMVTAQLPQSVTSPLDEFALADMCRNWSLMVRYHELLAADPLEREVSKMLATCQDKFLKYASRFGLSPVDRARIKATPSNAPDEADPFVQVLRMKSG